MKKYEDTKISGLDWLGEIPAHWQVKRLKNIARINPLKNISDDADDTVTFLPMEKVSEKGEIDCSLKRPVKDLLAGFTYFEKNDIILAKITPCFENGKGAYLNTLDTPFGFGSTEFHVIRTHDDLDSAFLYYVTTSNLFRDLGEASMTGSGGQKRVPTSFVENFPLAYPPLAEQRTIAAYLDRKTAQLDTLLAQKEALLQKLQQKRQALINEAVTQGLAPAAPRKSSGVAWLGEVPAHWTILQIKRLCRVKRGASPRPIDDEKYFDDNGQFAWVRISDVTASEKYLLTTEQRLSELGSSLSVKRYPGDLILSIAGSVGKPVITHIDCCIHDGFVCFDELKCNTDYLYYIFLGGLAFLGLGKLGTQLNLNIETVGNVYIGLPPEEEQQAIVDFIEAKTSKINEAAATIRTQIQTLKAYRQSLISEVVTGKVDVRPAAPASIPERSRPAVVQTNLFG